MKRLTALFALLCLALPAIGQDVPLQLDGQFDSVKVARLVTVYDDLQSAKAFPFDVILPKEAFRPTWTVPAGVVFVEGKKRITVISALKGEHKISASWGVIDFVKDETREDAGSVRFIVGEVPVPAPPKLPDVPPPPQTPTSFYFLIVRADGPASADFSRVMADPTWQELTKAGHSYKDKTKTDAASILGVTVPASVTLPAVFRLRISADRKTSTVVGNPIPLPTTPDGIRKLGENQ